MRERIREGPILIQGSGRVNFPHFLPVSGKRKLRLVPAHIRDGSAMPFLPLLFLSVTNTGW